MAAEQEKEKEELIRLLEDVPPHALPARRDSGTTGPEQN
jgi:hypothetical protein